MMFLALAGLALYWCQLFYQIQVEWTANDQYGYGWFVPLLAAVLFWRRWEERTESGGRRAEDESQWSVVSRQWAVVGGRWAVVFLMFMLLPLRIIHEANVGWRSAQWAHAVILVALTLILVWRAGGWAWVRHFGFPVLFLLAAVPWPMRLEGYLVQGLMRLVTAVTVEVVGMLGVPAMQRGNLLEIGSGFVSVNEACSGVRSLQTSLMIALFLGELYRLRYWRRLALVPTSLLIAFIANVGRTSFLTWSAARLGIGRMESLHSSAGAAVVVMVLGLLWLTAWLLARRPGTTDYGPRTTDYGLRTTDHGLRTTDHGPQTTDHRPPATGHLPHSAFLCLLAALGWLLCIEGGAAMWFRIGDKRAETNQAWSIKWPTEAPGYREILLSKTESDMLRYDTAKSVTWQDEAGNHWGFIALRWGPDNKDSFIGRGHTPDLCFTGAGWKLLAEPAPVRVTVNGIELPFRRYVFEVGGLTAHAFLTLWDDRSPGGHQETPFAYGLIRRLKAALQGKRHQGLKKLEISITGPASADEALGLLQKKLGEMIVPEGMVQR
jgi:exosortase